MIMQRIRDAERTNTFSEYKDRIGDIVTGTISAVGPRETYVTVGKTEMTLPNKERIPTEHYQVGDTVRAIITRVESEARGPSVTISRASPKFLEALFRLEVSEIADGVVEIMLLGQNVNSYGKNLEEPITFAELLQEVEKIEGLQRIRFMTSHPKDLSEDLIQVMKHSKKICRHLHLPLQAGSNKILKAMNRVYTKEQYIALAKHIREEIPDMAITTDLIVGFPGETLADVEETIEVVKEIQYDNAFTFIYSKRSGTPAAAMEQVPEEIVKEGFNKLLKVVQETARERVKRYEGMVMEALVEEQNEQDASLLTGRLSNNTIVHFNGDTSLIGKIVNVKLSSCQGFYYLGELV